jgi:hypothetical protein
MEGINMKLTKSQLKQLIQEELSYILEQEELPIEEDPLETPEAEAPPETPPTIRVTEKLREASEELILLASEVSLNNPNTAKMYNSIADSLERYSEILERPLQDLEGDEETQHGVEDSDYALKNLRKVGWKATKKFAGTGSQLAGGGRSGF